MVRQSETPASIEFGHFSIFPHRRQLLANGRPITLGGRAFDVLMALIDASGAVVSKDELLSRVWQGRIVEENRLSWRDRRAAQSLWRRPRVDPDGRRARLPVQRRDPSARRARQRAGGFGRGRRCRFVDDAARLGVFPPR
jgi:hypothetical protein